MQTKPKRKSNAGVGCLVVLVVVGIILANAHNNDVRNGSAATAAAAAINGLQYSEAAYTQAMSSGLGIVAGGRNILDVRVADGRENGGERAFFITYVSTESTNGDKVDEYLDLFDGAAATIAARHLDVDSVALIEANARGNPLQTIIAQADDLDDWHNVRIRRSEMIDRLEFIGL